MSNRTLWKPLKWIRGNVLWDGIKGVAKLMLPFFAAFGIREWVHTYSAALIWTTAFVVALVVVYADRFKRKPAKSSDVRSKDSESTLHAIADTDSREIEKRISYVIERMHCIPNLGAIEPYIDLSFFLLNLSVFTLTLEKVEGRLTYGPHGGPSLHFQATIPERGFNMEHAFQGELMLRQSVLPDTADKIAKSERVVLGTGTVALWFWYTDLLGERRSIRKAFPDQMFTIQTLTTEKIATFKIPAISGSIHRVGLTESGAITGKNGNRKIVCGLNMDVGLSNPAQEAIDIIETQLTTWPQTDRPIRTLEIRSGIGIPFRLHGNQNFTIDAKIEFEDDGSRTIPRLHLMCVDQYGAKHFAVLHGATLPALPLV
jgi:hypothetical protein